MKKLFPMLLLLLFLCAGCGLALPGLAPSLSVTQHQQLQSTTTVQLTTQNYRIVKNNVIGSDWGINFLGIVPIVSPDSSKAVAKMYKAGGVTEGRAQAVVNILQQHTAPFFILFSIPRITFRADVVEFTTPTPVP